MMKRQDHRGGSETASKRIQYMAEEDQVGSGNKNTQSGNEHGQEIRPPSHVHV